MLGIGNIVQAVAQSKRNSRNVYLNAFDQSFQETKNVASQLQSINSLISETKTRSVGFRFLIEYIKQCQHPVIEEKASCWLTFIIKACSKKEIELYGELTFEALALLLKRIQHAPDVSKWFGTTHLQRFYETLGLTGKNTSLTCSLSILKAVKQSLKYYPGPSKARKPLIQQYLLTLVDSSDPDVVYECGSCWLLLQQVRGNFSNGGYLNDKTQWQEFQLGLLGNLNTLLEEAFPNRKNVYNTTDNRHILEGFTLILHGDPVERAAQVFRRFCNLIDFLKIALSRPFPSNKLICPTKILHLIQSGLGMNLPNCVSSQNIDNLCYANLLPHMYSKLLELLEILLEICHTHLRMHFRLISEIILESLKKTNLSSADGSLIELVNFRSNVYRITILWLSILVEGSGSDLIVEYLVKSILEDVQIRQTDIYLVPMTNLATLQNSKLCSSTYVQSFKKEPLINKSKSVICQQALRCAQTILVSIGYLLKQSLLKDLFNTILEISIEIYENRAMLQTPYEDWRCRLEMYKTLFSFIKNRNLRYRPYAEIILYILEDCCQKDPSTEIRMCCKFMVYEIDKTLHPQKESYIFLVQTQNMQKSSVTIEQQQKLRFETENDALLVEKKYKRLRIDNDKHNFSIHNIFEAKREFTCRDNEVERNSEPQETNDILSTDHTNGKGIERYSELCKDEQHCKHSAIPNVKLSKNGDDKYIAELEAAFVDEFK